MRIDTRKNRDLRATSRRYYLKHCERIKARTAAYRLKNIEKMKLYDVEYQRIHKAHYFGIRRRSMMKRKYGLSVEQYADMLFDQNGRCAACGLYFGKESPHIDHCHATNVVRGLLHSTCNKAIGLLRDDPETIRSVASYLEKFRF
jgi:Recombination endonuclease VII